MLIHVNGPIDTFSLVASTLVCLPLTFPHSTNGSWMNVFRTLQEKNDYEGKYIDINLNSIIITTAVCHTLSS